LGNDRISAKLEAVMKDFGFEQADTALKALVKA
jgi:hypothetical protein